MNDKTLRLLEFDVIRERVAGRCLSEESQSLLAAASPLVEDEAVSGLKARVAEFVSLLGNGFPAPSLVFPAIAVLISRLGKEGAALELEEAYAVGLFAQSTVALASWLASERSGPSLQALGKELPDCSEVAREVFRIVDKDGSLRDLPELRAIKRALQGLRRELETITNRYLSDEDTRRMLQSEVATQRDGRMVLAVKSNYRNRIKGIIHEVSTTGQTIFVEPEDVVRKNNDILFEERRLASEVARILRELTARIGLKREELAVTREAVMVLDGLRARARYSLDTTGCFAMDANDREHEGRLALKKARHPLLAGSVVPIDLAMDAEIRVVIVTGPNTGGKTVALKTVGLFALMNQFGLALPLAEGSSLPVFDGVFADIGDEQSISQSLSTFSAHMTNMAYITSLATERSLVLLDELGSGTDPEEGSAIAMSLLDHFIACRSRVIVTTHHGILKNYGYTKPGVVNASVDFDAKTLSPTYRIVLGIPGESHAIEIASRNGLGADIVERSRTYLDEERADVSELIKGLKSKHQELDQAELARNREEQRLRDDRRKSDLRELRLRQKELELREQGVGSLRRLLLESRKSLENLVRELREGELTREKTLKVKEFIADLERSSAAENERLEQEEASLAELNEKEREELTRLALQTPEPKSASHSKKAGSRGTSSGKQENGPGKGRVGEPSGNADTLRNRVPSKVEPGIEVLVGTSRRRGLVLRSAKKGAWVVEIGALKMTFPERELSPVAPSATPKAEITIMDLAPSAPAAFELNLRGMRLEEALDALRRQVDAAAMSGLYEFSIIHGKGDGVLQKGVHEYLKSQKVVADYYFARPEDGGYGKTMVSLKR